MTPELKSRIRNTVQQARQLLIQETYEQLVSLYGLRPDYHFDPMENLPALKNNAYRQQTYRQLNIWIEEEIRGGMKRQEAVEKLLKETAFTWLNRLVAFKMMESLKLIRGAIDRGTESNGFKFYLAEHEEALRLYESGQVEEAYRHFLLWQCRQIAEQDHLEVLFDPDDLPSRLFPRPRALQQVLNLLNDPGLAEAWKQEETIGWVYQYFIEEDKDAVFEKIYRQKQKMDLRDIPKATQIFTPRWIVQYLVENTLGRLWLRMHPDSRLRDKMKYYVPNPYTDNQLLPVKSVREITLLDPACGTMHFGLVAFDLFYEMYLEELENAGKPGWPEKRAPVEKKPEAWIPVAIVENNLYGIDIDRRAIQLSALTLYLKVKRRNKNARLRKLNLTYTDIPPIPEKEVEEFVRQLNLHPVAAELLQQILPELNKAYYLGSLLKIEQVVQQFIRDKRRELEKQPLATMADFGQDAYRNPEAFWQHIKQDILQGLQELLENHTNSKQRVAGHAIRELGLIDALMKKYDVVVTNPPYAGRRNIMAKFAEELKKIYKNNAIDLYACFIQRNCELISNFGFVGMIAQQSFMFISSYQNLRNDIMRSLVIETMVHTGPHAFDDIAGEKVNTTAFVLRREPRTEEREAYRGVYFRLVHEPDSESKRRAFEEALATWRKARGELP